MRLFHATKKANINSILEEGFRGSQGEDAVELSELSGIDNVVFYSDSMEALIDAYDMCDMRPEVIIEVEVKNPFKYLASKILPGHEWVGSASDADILEIHEVA